MSKIEEDLFKFIRTNSFLDLRGAIEKGANVNCVDSNGITLLQKTLAMQHCNFTMIETLTSCGADVNCIDDCGNTPLHEVLSNLSKENCKIASHLIYKGADVNAVNDYGETPFYIFMETLHSFIEDKKDISKNSIYLLKLLLEKGAVLKVGHCGDTPPHIALDIGSEKCIELVISMIKKGSKINAVDQYGKTLLYKALKINSKKSLELAQLLVEKGAIA